MKKLFLFATAALFFTGASFAGNGEGKNKKKCAKGKTCCSKEKKEKKDCHKEKKQTRTTTAAL